jgi:hypothetical protein
MKRAFIFLSVVILCACSTQPSGEPIEPSKANTEAAKPSNTSEPTYITPPTNTNTLFPTDTATPTLEPTSTNTPTLTPTATMTPIPTESILYYEDFEDDRVDNWFVYRGNWSLNKEADGNTYWLGTGPNNYPQTWYSLDASTWTNYAFESKVRIVKGSVFICIRANKGSSFYNAYLSSGDGWVIFADFDGKTYNTFGGKSFPIQNNKWHTVRFEVQGDKLRLYIDGELATSATRTSHVKGGVGYYMGGGEEVHFDDLKVWSLSD